jgi:hypothetical protein
MFYLSLEDDRQGEVCVILIPFWLFDNQVRTSKVASYIDTDHARHLTTVVVLCTKRLCLEQTTHLISTMRKRCLGTEILDDNPDHRILPLRICMALKPA